MAPRQDLIASAVNLLQDPSVAASPIEKRIEFLRSKNLTQEEIDLALSQVGGEPQPLVANAPYYPPQQYQRPPPPGYGYGAPYGSWNQPPPEPPRRDWRDWFIMATVVGGASYGLVVLAQRYIKPLIAPPTPPQLEQDKAAIDEQFNRAFALLDTLSEDTTKLKEAEEARTQKLDTAISDIEAIVSELKAANLKREDDSRRMEAEVKNMKDSLPRALDSVKQGNEQQLKELSNELSSLKALMSNRMGSSSNFASANVPRAKNDPPAFSRSGTGTPTLEAAPNPSAANGSASVPSFASTTPSSTNVPTSSTPKSNVSSVYGAGKISIPSWQLQAQNKKDSSATNSTGNGTSTPTVDGADAIAALNAS